MNISGFTFLKNGVRLGYPFLESIRSILPLVDEFVVALGECDDETPQRLQELGKSEAKGKLRVIDMTWNTRAPSGYVYAAQSVAAHTNCRGDWAFYMQGDEVIHEDDHAAIRDALTKAHADPRVEGLYFDYLHFFGSGRTLACSPAWYRREVRIVRNTNLKIVMPSDAQYFTTIEGRKKLRYLRCIPANARMFHYGWARSTGANEAKQKAANAYYHKEEEVKPYSAIDPAIVKPFAGSHPAVVQAWVDQNAPASFTPDPRYRLTRRDKRQRMKMALERWFGIDTSKDHFTRVR
jgi:glycosyltransferase involved in cell wall biosynthesis